MTILLSNNKIVGQASRLPDSRVAGKLTGAILQENFNA